MGALRLRPGVPLLSDQISLGHCAANDCSITADAVLVQVVHQDQLKALCVRHFLALTARPGLRSSEAP